MRHIHTAALTTPPQRRWARLALVLGAVMLGALSASTAAAQSTANPIAQLEAGTVSEQLALDVTVVPTGMGAIFVPSLTRAELEPPVLVYYRGERVAWGRTGERIVLPPGAYRVIVGRGPLTERPAVDVQVSDGVTAPVVPFFAALRVVAVNTNGEPVEVSYRVRDALGGTVWGTGSTPESGRHGNAEAWPLPPGGVEIALEGDAQRAISLPIGAGQNVRYRLVVDGGQLVRAELATEDLVARERWWRLRWVVGGDVSLSSVRGALGSYNGDVWQAGVFTQAEMGVDKGNHLALLDLRLEQSWIGLSETDFETQKLLDEAQAELLYTYRLGRIAGPYARAMVRTSFFDTEVTPNNAQELTVVDIDGETVRTEQLEAGEPLRLLDAFAPREFREGAGLSLTLVDNATVNFILRAGAGARQARYDDGIWIESQRDGTLRAVLLADDTSFGAEGGLRAGLRLSSTFALGVEGDLYVPQDQLLEDAEFNPIFRVDSTATLSVNSFMSLVYRFNVRKDAYEIDDPQLSHLLSLRLQHTLF